MKTDLTVVFDIGKTNKKFFLFDEDFRMVRSAYQLIPEIVDDDGFPCDDLQAIEQWMFSIYQSLSSDASLKVSRVNFSTYGATMVHLDESGNVCTPLYNYLKPMQPELLQGFESRYGNFAMWSRQTASPMLGMLNAGLQLYWLKNSKPNLFRRIKTSLFLPQYFCYRFSNRLVSEFTSIGCHTGMWDFSANNFHHWMYEEDFVSLLPPLFSGSDVFPVMNSDVVCGVGVHDSSAALVPYLKQQHQPFLLLSTGTWSICMNPFNHDTLTEEELSEDCLCFLSADGLPVKASRFFLGAKFTEGVIRLNNHFGVDTEYHKTVSFSEKFLTGERKNVFVEKYPESFSLAQQLEHVIIHSSSFDEAYHGWIYRLVNIQLKKIQLVLNDAELSNIFIDGGFAGNVVFVSILQAMLPGKKLIPSEMPLGSALGAAMLVNDDVLKGLRMEVVKN
jgi:L-fuculokinase